MFPQPGEWVPTYQPRDDNDRASARARCADGLFAYQRSTVQWMQGVEAGRCNLPNDPHTVPLSRCVLLSGCMADEHVNVGHALRGGPVGSAA